VPVGLLSAHTREAPVRCLNTIDAGHAQSPIQATSEMEAKAFAPLVKPLGIKKADMLYTNNDFGIGAAQEFATMLKAEGVEIGAREAMDPKAVDFSAQLAKIKASGGDTRPLDRGASGRARRVDRG